MVFVDFMTEGDIRIGGLPDIDLIIFHHPAGFLLTYTADDTVTRHEIKRSQVWEYLVGLYPQLLTAHKNYHHEIELRYWTEHGVTCVGESF